MHEQRSPVPFPQIQWPNPVLRSVVIRVGPSSRGGGPLPGEVPVPRDGLFLPPLPPCLRMHPFFVPLLAYCGYGGQAVPVALWPPLWWPFCRGSSLVSCSLCCFNRATSGRDRFRLQAGSRGKSCTAVPRGAQYGGSHAPLQPGWLGRHLGPPGAMSPCLRVRFWQMVPLLG